MTTNGDHLDCDDFVTVRHALLPGRNHSLSLTSRVASEEIAWQKTSECQPMQPDVDSVTGLTPEAACSGAPAQVWAADITYIDTGKGRLYLAGLIDAGLPRCVGWQTGESLPAALVPSLPAQQPRLSIPADIRASVQIEPKLTFTKSTEASSKF